MHGLVVSPGHVQDRDGAKLVLKPLVARMPRLERLWADGGYAGQLVDWVREQCGWELEIVKRADDAIGFAVLPKRWIVERTVAWLGKCRRLSKVDEHTIASSEALIRLAMIGLMLRRLHPCP
jgi:putative transposase